MILRPYQTRAIAELRAQYAAGRKAPCLVMPTGSGKTPTAAEIIRSALARGRRVLFLAGRIELLDQAVRKLADAGVTDVRVIQADRDTGNASPVIVASVQTLASARWRGQLPPADIAVVDECHHVKARTWSEIAQHYPTRLGLTATPERGDGAGLSDMFDAIVVGSTVQQLVDLKHLVPCRVYAPPTVLDPRSLALDPLDAYQRHCASTKTVVFATTVVHAAQIAANFRDHGVRAEHVSGSMSQRPDVIARFIRRDFDVLVNVALLVEGFDDPAIESAIFAKRFTHVGGYLQAIGRCLRPSPGKTKATVVDLCGSALVHGTPDIERVYSLEGVAISKADRQQIRQCPSCGGVFPAADVCPFCSMAIPHVTRSLPKSIGAGVDEVTAKTKPTSWPMRAKKQGFCSGCGGVIEIDAWIVYSRIRREAQHTSCVARIARAARGAA